MKKIRLIRTIDTTDIKDGDSLNDYVKREFQHGAFVRTTYASELRKNVHAHCLQNGFKVLGYYRTGYGLYFGIVA